MESTELALCKEIDAAGQNEEATREEIMGMAIDASNLLRQRRTTESNFRMAVAAAMGKANIDAARAPLSIIGTEVANIDAEREDLTLKLAAERDAHNGTKAKLFSGETDKIKAANDRAEAAEVQLKKIEGQWAKASVQHEEAVSGLKADHEQRLTKWDDDATAVETVLEEILQRPDSLLTVFGGPGYQKLKDLFVRLGGDGAALPMPTPVEVNK